MPDFLLASRANDLARLLGRVVLLAGDISSGDARYTGLPVADRHVVVEQALTCVRELEAEQLSFLGPPLESCAPILQEERASASPVSAGGGMRPPHPPPGR